MAKQPAKPTVVPKAAEPKRAVDIDAMLTDAEKAEIRAKAKAKVAARDKLDAEEAFLKQEMERIDRESHPEVFPEMRDIVIDIALYADRVILDGKQYFAGERYTVTKPVYDVLMEMGRNTYRHERELKGNADDEFYRKERNTTLNWKTGQVHNAPSARF